MAGKKIIVRTLLMAVLLFLGACASRGPEELSGASLISGERAMDSTYAGNKVNVLRGRVSGGLLVPDGAGQIIHLPGSEHDNYDSGYVDARELKLKIRELGEQLAAGLDDCSLLDSVALPVSFVDLGDFERTSPLGRLMAEQLYHELHQRGYPVREYRLPKSIRIKPQQGEFALSRELGRVATGTRRSVVVVGTYQQDKDAIFVNARLVSPSDGKVLRTANLVMRPNDLTRRMLRGGNGTTLKKLEGGGMRIRDFDTAMRPPASASSSPFDRGEDIH